MFATPGTEHPDAHAVLMPTSCTIEGVDRFHVLHDGNVVGCLLRSHETDHCVITGGMTPAEDHPNTGLAEAVDIAVGMYAAAVPWWHGMDLCV